MSRQGEMAVRGCGIRRASWGGGSLMARAVAEASGAVARERPHLSTRSHHSHLGSSGHTIWRGAARFVETCSNSGGIRYNLGAIQAGSADFADLVVGRIGDVQLALRRECDSVGEGEVRGIAFAVYVAWLSRTGERAHHASAADVPYCVAPSVGDEHVAVSIDSCGGDSSVQSQWASD